MIRKHLLLTLLIFNAINVLYSQTIPNAGMEDWTTTNGYDSLNSWTSSNLIYKLIDQSLGLTNHPSSVLKHSGGKSGAYSVELKNVVGTTSGPFTTPIDTVPGVIVASSGTGNNVVPGFPVSSRPAFLTGYYNFTQGGTGTKPNIDTAFIAVGFTKYNTNTNQTDSIGGGFFFITSTTNGFKPFSVILMYLPGFTGVVPDTATIFIASSIAQKSFPNTSLLIDDLAFSSVSGIKTALFTNGLPSTYPNPITTDLTISNLPKEIASIEIKDFTGSVIVASAVNEETIRLNLNHLSNGIYLYTLKEEDGTAVYSSKILVAK